MNIVENLKIPERKLVLDPDRFKIVTTYDTVGSVKSRDDWSKWESGDIEVALVMPKEPRKGAVPGFDMMLVEVIDGALSTSGAHVVQLSEGNRGFEIHGAGFMSIYLDKENNYSWKNYVKGGYEARIRTLKQAIDAQRDILTAKEVSQDDWEKAAVNLLPYVAKFFDHNLDQEKFDKDSFKKTRYELDPEIKTRLCVETPEILDQVIEEREQTVSDQVIIDETKKKIFEAMRGVFGYTQALLQLGTVYAPLIIGGKSEYVSRQHLQELVIGAMLEHGLDPNISKLEFSGKMRDETVEKRRYPSQSGKNDLVFKRILEKKGDKVVSLRWTVTDGILVRREDEPKKSWFGVDGDIV